MEDKNKLIRRVFKDSLPLAEVFAQGRLLRVRVVHRLLPNRGRRGRTRGTVAGFSRASRKRMLELLSRLDPLRAGLPCFVTLTYPDLDGPPSHAHTERDRQAFFKRMKRRFPLASGLWRREFQSRKTGAHIGAAYPHYHLLLFNLPFFPHERLNIAWREVIGHSGYVRTEIEAVMSWRGAFHYAAKYMAKPGVATEDGGGGPAGAGAESEAVPERPAPGPAGAGAHGSLVCTSYLTVNGERETEAPTTPVGRAWGVFNRKCLPYADKRVEHLALGPWLPQAKELARSVWPRIDELQPQMGFTLFVDDAEVWAAAILSLYVDPLPDDRAEESGP